ncbi:hypothetical protein OIU85_021687 [Salix viminalis]|uniref:Uncharacterized protein n=1 Tax=Salix viminalis TaxID=40686 RepID=A0A9Q0ZDW4_SALVM|nr:hypothetical protein OIU85_021687 [Salix viminalis]
MPKQEMGCVSLEVDFGDYAKLKARDLGDDAKRKKRKFWFILSFVVYLSFTTAVCAKVGWDSTNEMLNLRIHKLPFSSAIFPYRPLVVPVLLYLLFCTVSLNLFIKILQIAFGEEDLDDHARLNARGLGDFANRKNGFVLFCWVIVSLITALVGWIFTGEISIIHKLPFLFAVTRCLPYLISALTYLFISTVLFGSIGRRSPQRIRRRSGMETASTLQPSPSMPVGMLR